MRIIIAAIIGGAAVFAAVIARDVCKRLDNFQDPFTTEWFIAEEEKAREEEWLKL